GTAEFACPSLVALHEAGHEIAAIVTQPDRPRGRRGRPAPPPLKARAQALGLGCPVLQPERVREPAALEAIEVAGPFDVGVVVAYGQILPRRLLDLPRLGCVNVHASLLPRWRGAAPVQRAIAAGDRESGVTIQRMVERLDAGPVLATVRTAIEPRETAEQLLARLAPLGAEALLETLPRLARGEVEPIEQDEAQASYAPVLRKAEGAIDWTASAAAIDRHVRAMTPWPRAFTFLHREAARPERLVVHELGGRLDELPGAPPDAAPGTIGEHAGAPWVRCGDGWVALERLQPAGKRPMDAAAWWRGRPARPGDRLGPAGAPR
ncbi:MAG: methionyl-tRNA formyltransferase, partial [Planctomycetota bacterium]